MMTDKTKKKIEEEIREFVQEFIRQDIPEEITKILGAVAGTFFLRGVEWQKEQMVEKTCEWLKENVSDYVITGKSIETYEGIDINRLINELKKEMEAGK